MRYFEKLIRRLAGDESRVLLEPAIKTTHHLHDPFENTAVIPLVYPSSTKRDFSDASGIKKLNRRNKTTNHWLSKESGLTGKTTGEHVNPKSDINQLGLNKGNINKKADFIYENSAKIESIKPSAQSLDKNEIQPRLELTPNKNTLRTSTHSNVRGILNPRIANSQFPITDKVDLNKYSGQHFVATKPAEKNRSKSSLANKEEDRSTCENRSKNTVSKPVELTPLHNLKNADLKPIDLKLKNKKQTKEVSTKLVIGRLKVDVVPVKKSMAGMDKKQGRYAKHNKSSRRKNKGNTYQINKMDFGVGQM